MFFIFSKILAFLAQPLAIIGILIVAGWIVRNQRWKKILYTTAVVIFFFCSNFFIANEVTRAWETPVTPFASITKKYDYGILLTGVTKTEMKPKDRVYFSRGADRATHTLQLYKLGIIRKVIISGGSGRLDGGGVLEADDLASFLELAGMPDEDIIIENRSKNTHESAVNVGKILSKIEGPKELLLITSAFHIPRSMACFKKMGIQADAFATDPNADERSFNLGNLLLPRLEAIAMWQMLIREWIGFVAYWFAGYI
ncbi:MAG: YdcF family protein [Bacteroidota bacterium]